jgi:hypothetical protein
MENGLDHIQRQYQKLDRSMVSAVLLLVHFVHVISSEILFHTFRVTEQDFSKIVGVAGAVVSHCQTDSLGAGQDSMLNEIILQPHDAVHV